mmetsp:Transcript_7487/g.8999  ORF Transcript_7487/g.8999 Transcript_7487/m.8999 type:complete len:346 (+) Transcript_7487:69-1106(+)
MSERTIVRILARIENENVKKLLTKLELKGSKIRTAREIIDLSPLEIQKLLDTTLWEAKQLLRCVSEVTAPQISSLVSIASKSSQQPTFYPTGIRTLDSALRGGLRAGHINEIVGRAGAGKTQCCLTAALSVASKGYGVVYIDTENKFSAERVEEIIVNSKFSDTVEQIAKRIIVIKPVSSKQVLAELQALEVKIISNKVRLLLVDSVAALVRLDYSSRGQIFERQKMLSKQASQLKYLANTFSIPVLVTNQVSSFESTQSKESTIKTAEGVSLESTSSEPSYAMLNPTLGNTWAHCVNVRILIEVLSEYRARRMRIIKSPSCASMDVYVAIKARGIVGIDETIPE